MARPGAGEVALRDLYLYPEVHAAIANLRRLSPQVDLCKIGLLGHSDGGTAVMVAASAD